MPLLINQGTNAAINFDLSGTVNTQVVGIGYGTLSTLGTLPNLPQGSIQVTAGTIASVGTIGTVGLATVSGNLGTIGTIGLATIAGNVGVNSGTINVATISGNLGTIGTIGLATISGNVGMSSGTLNIGSITGKDANAAAQTANPISIGGTDSGGTVRTVLVDSTGAMKVSGASSGTFVNLSTGTLNAGTINLGTVVGKDANAAAQTGNPIGIGGTDSGGTIRTINVDSTGAVKTATTVNVTVGTINVGTINTGTFVMPSGTLTVMPNIPGGTLNLVQTISTVSMLSAGTLTTIPNIPGGTIGSVIGVGSVSGLSNLPGGSITVTVGTVINRYNDLVDSNNNSTGTLGVGGTYLGTSTSTVGYSAVALYVYSDQNSAANGVQVQFSSDGTSFNDATLDTFTAGNAAPNDGQTYLAASRGQFYRVKYINGGTAQTAFRLNTVLKVGAMVGDIIPVADVPTSVADHAQLSKAALMGKTTAGGGAWVDVKVNPSGALQVDPANGTVQISAGTINLGTITGNVGISSGTISSLPNLPGGTLNLVQTISTISMLSAGTLTTIPNIPGGTIGSVVGIGSVSGLSNLPGGSITVTTGTVNVGSIVKTTAAPTAGSFTAAGTITVAGSQLDYAGFDVGGTWVGTVFTEGQIGTSSWFAIPYSTNLGALGGTTFTGNGDYFVSMAGLDGVRARITYSSGTLTYNARQSNFFAPLTVLLGGSVGNIGMLNAGTISALPNLPGGSIAVTAGTINTGTITAGSIIVTAGTVSAGTINVGTVQINPLTATNTISHAGTSGTLGIGTLVGTSSIGAGTALYPTNYRVVVVSGTAEVILAFGSQTNGNQVVHHGLYPAGGGIASPVPYPHGYGTTNSPLTYQILSGSGTVSWDVDYFTHT